MRGKEHASTVENDEYNLIEGREQRKGIHASTVENDEYNLIEGREEKKETHVRR